MNSVYNQPAIEALYAKYEQEGDVVRRDDIMKAIMRHHWKSELYSPPALEKVMKLNFYNGVMNYARREIKRFFTRKRDVRPVAVESEFCVDGEAGEGDVKKAYRLCGIFDRIEG